MRWSEMNGFTHFGKNESCAETSNNPGPLKGLFRHRCVVARGPANQPREDAAGLSRVSLSITQQDAEALGQSGATRGPARRYAAERGLGDELRARSAGNWTEAVRTDDFGYRLCKIDREVRAAQLPNRAQGRTHERLHGCGLVVISPEWS